jgi:hypothetical protein
VFIASQFVSLTIGLVEMDQCFNFTKRIKGNRIAHSKAPNCTDASAWRCLTGLVEQQFHQSFDTCHGIFFLIKNQTTTAKANFSFESGREQSTHFT